MFLFSLDARLGVGSYLVAAVLHTSSTRLGKSYEWRDLTMVFNVANMEQQGFVGVSWLSPELEIS